MWVVQAGVVVDGVDPHPFIEARWGDLPAVRLDDAAALARSSRATARRTRTIPR